MKITKTAADAANYTQRKINANIGCNKCPFCGETKSNLQYIKEGNPNKGISTGFKHWCEGFFRSRYMQCDTYTCYSCGAEWESEPY